MPTPGQEEDFKNQIPIVTGPNPVTYEKGNSGAAFGRE